MNDNPIETLYEDLKVDLNALAEKHGKRFLDEAARDATNSHLLHGIAQDLTSGEPTAGERDADAGVEPSDYEEELIEYLVTKVSPRLGKEDSGASQKGNPNPNSKSDDE